MNKGYIYIDRAIQDSAIWTDETEKFCKRAAWIDMIMLANHKDKEVVVGGKVRVIKRGSHHTSMQKLAKRWMWDRRTVSQFFCTLQLMGMITTKRTAGGTTFSIENYDKYQNKRTTNCSTKSTSECTPVSPSECTLESPQTRNDKRNDKGMNKENKGRDNFSCWGGERE